MLLHATYYNYAITCWSSSFISTTLPRSPPPTTIQISCKEQIKIKFALPCGRTVTSQGHFGGQNGVPHEIGGSENGTLLGTRAETVTESQPKWYEKSSSNGWFCWQENHLICYRTYRITNIVFEWQVYQAGVGQGGAHMMMPYSCHMLHHGTKDWLSLAYTKLRMFPTYCTNHGAEFRLKRGAV